MSFDINFNKFKHSALNHRNIYEILDDNKWKLGEIITIKIALNEILIKGDQLILINCYNR